MAQIEKKINMTLDDIIKSSSTRTGGGGGAERRQPKAADERIPLPRNGIAPKFIGASSRQPAGRTTGRQAQNSRALGLGTTRQAPLKKYAQSRAPLHVSIPPAANTAPARAAGRAAGKVTDVRVTIPNNRKVRSLPPPGFASDDLPPGMPARGGQAVPGRGARTLNERFTAVLSGPVAAPARRRNTGTVARGGRRGGGGGGGGGIAPMEM